ncbi:hypothetical protein GCM10009735_34820 [Actinomadura chokoriensis]|jgi:hypothetical protein
MDVSVVDGLRAESERLARENAWLRGQLAALGAGNPPPELERAFGWVGGWQCLRVPVPGRSALILIAADPVAAGPAGGVRGDAAGEVWRYLQAAEPPGGRIGPFARARMPGPLLGYRWDQDGGTAIVLNQDLCRGRLSRAARMLRSFGRNSPP